MQDKPTLCWKCSRACGQCSWSAEFRPINGWVAIKTIIKADKGLLDQREIDSYIVLKCPQFHDDTDRYKTNKKIAPPVMRVFRNPSNKSPLRRSFEALPKDEIERRINGLPDNKEIARMAFLENKTSAEIGFIIGRCNDTVRKIIAKVLHLMTEAVA